VSHEPCLESCACWVRGATDEAKIRQPRPGIRQLTGYIRAVSDSNPGLSDEDMARRVVGVFIPATPTPDTRLRECFVERTDCRHGVWESLTGDHFAEHLRAALTDD